MTNNLKDDGGTTSYYQFPEDVKQLQDLIEYRGMNFQIGNIFKAAFRINGKSLTNEDILRDLRKIKWFALREIERIEKGESNEDN